MNVGLVFGIIFTVIVIGFLLFFGFTYINEMFTINCDAILGDQIIKFREQVSRTFQLSLGANQKFDFVVPSCLEKVCFVDPESPHNFGNWQTNNVLTRMIELNKYNMVTFYNDGTFKGYNTDHMKAEYNFCISSKKTLSLKNDGSFVVVKS